MEALDPDSEAAAATAQPAKGASPVKEEEDEEDDFAAQASVLASIPSLNLYPYVCVRARAREMMPSDTQ